MIRHKRVEVPIEIAKISRLIIFIFCSIRKPVYEAANFFVMLT